MRRSLVGLVLWLCASLPAYAVPVSGDILTVTTYTGSTNTNFGPIHTGPGTSNFNVSTSVANFFFDQSLLGVSVGVYEGTTLVALVGIPHVEGRLSYLAAADDTGLGLFDFDSAAPVRTVTITDIDRTVDVSEFMVQNSSSGFVASAFFTVGPDAPAPVPLPGALPLFVSGLAGLGLLGWSKKRTANV